jgi:carbon storage regulator
MLVLARKLDEAIIIGDDIRVTVVELRGRQVRLGIEAPDTVVVLREELFDPVRPRDDFGRMSASGLETSDGDR